MPKNLTEDNSSYPATVTVPLGGDSHSTLAEYMEAFVQVLANRTAWLKDMVNRSNTWTTQQFVDTAQNPDMPYLISTRTPGECNVTGTPEPTNPWRMIAKLPTGITSNVFVRLYWGDGTEGVFAAVTNAYWRPHSQQWRQEDATFASYALIVGIDGAALWRKPSGSGDWNKLDWTIHGTWSGKNIDASVGVTSPLFTFPTPIDRITQLPLGSAFGPVDKVLLGQNNRIYFDSGLSSTVLADGIKWPIPLLPNNEMGNIRIAFYIDNAGDTFQWHRRRQNPDYSTSYTAVGAAHTTDGVNKAYASISPPSGIQDGDEYELVWKLDDETDPAQVNSNRVYALQREWTQYGPLGGGS